MVFNNILYSLFLRYALLPVGDILFGSIYLRSCTRVRNLLSKDKDVILKHQKDSLESLIKHVLNSSQFYKKLEIDLDENPYITLTHFPILTKDLLQDNIENILTVEKNGLIKNSTSGSTGKQTEVYISKKEQSLIRAIQTIWWEWAGYVIGYPMLQTGLASKRTLEKRLKDIFFRTYYQFAFGLDNENVKDGLEWAKNKSPILGGYASSLYVLAELSEKRNITMKAAISWGDKLFDHYKESIERVFNCKVYETYGASEGLMMASQKDLPYMYMMDPFYIIEILDENGKEVPDGDIGHLVVTSLIHKSMPLIRYKVGDLAIKLPKEEYPEAREFQLSLLKKVIGRETDLVKLKNGKSLIVHSFTGVLEYFKEIKQFQVIYLRNGQLEIRYIKGLNFNIQVLDVIKEKLNLLADCNLSIIFKEVDIILPSKSGKPQILLKEE